MKEMSFKDSAFLVLKRAKKPLHVAKITELAIKMGLSHNGKTPTATMAAQLAMDVKNGSKSRFKRVSPSTYALNPAYQAPRARKPAPLLPRLSEDFVKNSVIKWLSANGWGHFQFDELHAHGVDLRARHHRYPRYFYVEAKGEGKIPQANENYFVSSLGQIITRMRAGGSTRNYYGLALPEAVAKIALRRIPWQVAKKLLLYVFAINHEGHVTRYAWKDMKGRGE